MKKSILLQASSIAMQKLSNHPELNNFIHFSFIVQNQKIVVYGRNNKRMPAKHLGYHKRINDAAYGPKTHSELDAYKKGKSLLIKGRPFEMINIRLTRIGLIRNSKPCCCCYDIMKELGCRRFYYSSSIGFMSIS
jgi:tRNA(Arg) A34 adenosine deaminase TadA